MLVRSKWLAKILPLPKKSDYILHDYWTALVVSKFGKMAYLEEPQVKYRQHFDNCIGSKRRSDEIQNFDEMRALFMDVKKDHFKTLIQNSDCFEDDEIRNLNKISYQYFQDLKKIKNWSFKNSKLFWRLYQYENGMYGLQNFLILQMPGLAKPLFNFVRGVKN